MEEVVEGLRGGGRGLWVGVRGIGSGVATVVKAVSRFENRKNEIFSTSTLE